MQNYKVYALVAVFIALAVSGVSPTPAQSAGLNGKNRLPNVPAGISVYVDGTATTSDVAITQEFDAKLQGTTLDSSVLAAATEALSGARNLVGRKATVSNLGVGLTPGTVGLTPGTNVSAPTEVQQRVLVTTSPANIDFVTALLTKHAFVIAGNPQLVARDPNALENAALANAVRTARQRAAALAMADHRRIGRLLNVVPTPIEMARDALAGINPLGSILGQFLGGQSGGPVTARASGIFTFALLP